ncbi:MAG: peptidylprolyl isomerase [Pseudomonadota bacterium]
MRALLVVAGLCAAMGCRGEPALEPTTASPPSGDGPVVASSASDRVTLEELQAFLDGFSPARQVEVAPAEGRRVFLRNYLLYRAALWRAEATGYRDDPRVRRVRDRAMARHWTEDRVASYQAPPITDEEVRVRWEREKAPDRPARIRARHILLVDREAAEALREELLAALARPGAEPETIFAAAAREHSLDEKTRAKGGDLLFFSRGGDELAWHLAPRPVLEAALAIHTTGQVSRALEGPDGAHLVMVTARREAVRDTLEDATGELRGALARERVDAARKALEAELLDMDDWTVDDGALEDLVVAPTLE